MGRPLQRTSLAPKLPPLRQPMRWTALPATLFPCLFNYSPEPSKPSLLTTSSWASSRPSKLRPNPGNVKSEPSFDRIGS